MQPPPWTGRNLRPVLIWYFSNSKKARSETMMKRGGNKKAPSFAGGGAS